MFIYLLFFISGLCALVYEVVWGRMLVLVMGNTTLAASAILTAFMAGLSLGGVYWGRRVDKTKYSALYFFGCLEVGIGVTAVLVSQAVRLIVPLEVYVSQLSDWIGFMPILVRFIACFCLLAVPTFLMGGTLAAVGKHVVYHGGHFGRHLAGLYGINTAGSFMGAFLAGFLLIKYFGHTGSLLTAAVLNCMVGILAIWMGSRGKTHAATMSMPPIENTQTPTEYTESSRKTAILILIGLGISGLCAIVYQILWTRLLILIIDNSVYSFTIILMGFLAGIALGSFVAIGCFRYFKNRVLLFALVEISIGISAFCFPFLFISNPISRNCLMGGFYSPRFPWGCFYRWYSWAWLFRSVSKSIGATEAPSGRASVMHMPSIRRAVFWAA